jgi:hypothetical protein
MTNEESGAMQVDEDITQHLAYIPDAWGTVRALGIDKYPGEMAIVRELVQNADDAFDRTVKVFPTYVRFNLRDDELVMEHDGKPFSKPPEDLLRKGDLSEHEEEELNRYDFARISRIGVGKTDEEMTGKFGTGFTAVFHVTDNPRIESNGWDFQIHIRKRPVVKEIPQDRVTRIHLPYRRRQTEISSKIGAEVFDKQKRKRFRQQILAESYRIIFFLKNLTRIEVFEDDGALYCVQRIERRKRTSITGISCRDVTIVVRTFEAGKCSETHEKWWIYSLADVPIPSRFDALGLKLNQGVSIAISKAGCAIGDKLGVGNHSYFTFPIRETGFRFKYNASRFFTTTDRSEFIIKEGLKNAWNKWQIENLAALLAKVVSELNLGRKTPGTVYSLLPQPHEYNHEYDRHLIESFRARVQAENLTVFFSTSGEWVGPRDLYLGDERLERILPRNHYRHFVDLRYIQAHKRTLEYYGAKPVSHRDLIAYLKQNHKKREFRRRFQTTSNREKIVSLRLMLEYLGSSELDPRDVEELKDLSFILTEAGTLQAADYSVYFPSDEDMPLINPDDIVHHLVYASKHAESFLQNTLGIKKMDLRDLIVDSFLRRLGQYDEKQKLEFVLYLATRAGQVTGNEEILQGLKRHVWEVLNVEINNPGDREIYFPDGELRKVFGNRLNYLSHEYKAHLGGKTKAWKRLFKAVGVKEFPRATAITGLVDEISNEGFSDRSVAMARRLFAFLSRSMRGLTEEERLELKDLNGYRWIPCENRCLDYPDEIYVEKSIRHLVGSGQSFVLFSVSKQDPLVRLLGMRTEPILDDVVGYLLDHCAEINGDTDRQVDYRIYSYLSDRAEDLDEELAIKLRENRTVWYRGRLWYPRNVFLRSHGREFGRSGEVRAYLPRLKALNGLCSLLRIREYPVVPDDYVDFLLDISDRGDDIEVSEWREYVENAHERLAYSDSPVSGEQRQALSESRVMVVHSHMRRPTECYLIRGTDRLYKDRIERCGIAYVPFVLENDAHKERFYLSMGVREIYDFVVQRRAGHSRSEACAGWKKRLAGFIPWINGYAYRAVGEEGLPDLDVLRTIDARRVAGLRVSYGIEHGGQRIMGSPIDDYCCLDVRDSGDHVLYLDESFDERENDHLSLLSNLLTTLIGSHANFKRVEWIMLMNQYFRHGEISGVNPYHPRRPEGATEGVEVEDEAVEETGNDATEEHAIQEREATAAPSGRTLEETEEREEVSSAMTTSRPSEQDDGLRPPEHAGQTRKAKRPKASAPRSRGGTSPAPHAIEYEEERNWVREQAGNFCQACTLFCERCEVEGVEGRCPCEVRKNAEKALHFHHLEPFEKDPARDVRGNLVMLCGYHHEQLRGTNLKSGYLGDKVEIEEREFDVVLTSYPKDKDETELRLRLSKEHFQEFRNYAEGGSA